MTLVGCPKIVQWISRGAGVKGFSTTRGCPPEKICSSPDGVCQDRTITRHQEGRHSFPPQKKQQCQGGNLSSSLFQQIRAENKTKKPLINLESLYHFETLLCFLLRMLRDSWMSYIHPPTKKSMLSFTEATSNTF